MAVELHVLTTTVTGNSDDGQYAAIVFVGSIALHLADSIVSDNAGGDLDSVPNGGGDPTATIDYSIVGDVFGTAANAAFLSGTGNIDTTDPQLGPLTDNGGTTLTHLSFATSPAVDKGDPSYSGLTSDQRGLARVVTRLDMEAVEIQDESDDSGVSGSGLAATGTDAAAPLTGGVLLLATGALLLLVRRRRLSRQHPLNRQTPANQAH